MVYCESVNMIGSFIVFYLSIDNSCEQQLLWITPVNSFHESFMLLLTFLKRYLQQGVL